MPNWEEIQIEWETTKITFKALAEKHGVKEGTLKSRRSREGWSRHATDATKKSKRVATDPDSDSGSDRKRTSSNANEKKRRNRSGNPNPKNQFTERNTAALKHGLFSRYIPQETLAIMGVMDKDNPADLLWDQIMIQYAAIIRAQQIMFVQNQDDTAKELKKLKVENVISAEGIEVQMPVEQEYEIQFAWDRHATFMNAQSRAIGELRTSIKQFCEMAYDNDERLLKLEGMQVGIDKTRAEIDKLTGDGDDGPIEIMITRKGGR
ncbi:phage terminase small subunit [Sporosarcina obsidiansis]|uniref:phage terminase small subunit n=1 Tax=Sporosarcina obsidiansis TaxID=2660748 RepID=UPI00129AE61D|nr:phage terminase small subunit [Sporosarcina obsidiansis]